MLRRTLPYFAVALCLYSTAFAENQFPFDVNNDSCFNQTDLTVILQSGLYDTKKPATTLQGDFDGDGFFDPSDLVFAFQSGLYETCQSDSSNSDNDTGIRGENNTGNDSLPSDTSSIAWPSTPFEEGTEVRVFGREARSASTITLPSPDTEGSYAWTGETGWERIGSTPDFLPFASDTDLDVSDPNWISFQSIITANRMDFFVPKGTRFIALEYKDNLLSPQLDPYEQKSKGPGVRINGTKIGELEALRDHRWKRVVLEIPSNLISDRSLRVEVGRGSGHYGEIHGSMLLHSIIASPVAIPARPAASGYWPATKEVVTNGQLFDRFGKPYVPLIVSAPQAYIARNQIDSLDLLKANTNFAIGHHEGSGQTYWEPNDLYIEDFRVMGIATKMTESIKKGYYTVPWHFSDSQAYYIRRVGKSMQYEGETYRELYNGTWNGVVDVWKATLEDLVKENVHTPFIYLKDELDHEDQTYWGAFEEMALELRAEANEIVPNVPTMVTMMGWKPLMLHSGFELADIVASDRYPVRGIDRLERVAEWNEELRRVAKGKPFVWVMTLEPKADIRRSPEELRTLSYIALAHGARGLWYFGDRGSMAEKSVQDFYGELGFVIDEIKSLQDIIHGSAKELARTVASTSDKESESFPQTFKNIGWELSAYDGISATLRESSTRKVLLAVSERNAQQQQRFSLPSLKAGDTIEVLFEGRTLTAAEDGYFEDSFRGYERHLYLVP